MMIKHILPDFFVLHYIKSNNIHPQFTYAMINYLHIHLSSTSINPICIFVFTCSTIDDGFDLN